MLSKCSAIISCNLCCFGLGVCHRILVPNCITAFARYDAKRFVEDMDCLGPCYSRFYSIVFRQTQTFFSSHRA